MATNADREAVGRLIEAGFNRGDMAAIDAIVDPNVVDHAAAPHHAPGVQGVKDRVAVLRSGFPDLTMTIEDLLSDDDRVVFRYSVSGTFTGDLPFATANGKSFRVTGINIERVRDGRIVERWSNRDDFGLNQQLGIS